jgi:hypothetical protein
MEYLSWTLILLMHIMCLDKHESGIFFATVYASFHILVFYLSLYFHSPDQAVCISMCIISIYDRTSSTGFGGIRTPTPFAKESSTLLLLPIGIAHMASQVGVISVIHQVTHMQSYQKLSSCMVNTHYNRQTSSASDTSYVHKQVYNKLNPPLKWK